VLIISAWPPATNLNGIFSPNIEFHVISTV
jgi:hypothetical protein